MPDRATYPPQTAQPPGKTVLQFSPNGKRLLAAGDSDFARFYCTTDGECPEIVNELGHERQFAIVCGDDFAIFGAEDGTVYEWSITSTTGTFKDNITRCSLPIRDLALSPDQDWVAVCSDELEVKIVYRHDILRQHILRGFSKPVKHVSYSPDGKHLTASGTDGIVYIYDMSEEPPKRVRTIDGVIQRLETVDEASSECVWHPAGEVFASANSTRGIAIVSVDDGKTIHTFANGHNAQITGVSWSSNGALLASVAKDNSLVLWDVKQRKILMRKKYEKSGDTMLNIQWHTQGENLLCWTNDIGECYIQTGFLTKPEDVALLSQPPSTFEGQGVESVKPVQPLTNGHGTLVNGRPRAETPDSLDDLLNEDLDGPDGGEDWLVDDDGAGYAEKNKNGKRPFNGETNGYTDKRSRISFNPSFHEPFQSGSTDWVPPHQNKRYLAFNLVGYVIATKQEEERQTVDIKFFDQEEHRNTHFTEYFQYDKACLNDQGLLLSSPYNHHAGYPAMLFYRPHETWTNRHDFRITLPDGEEPTCIALSHRYIIACTNKGFVRVWTLYGTPVKLWRLKSAPAVTCAAHGDHVMTISNGPLARDAYTQLVYSIDDIRNDETCQSEDIVALGLPVDADGRMSEAPELKSLFWSDTGDPCIFDNTGVCSILQHWRTPGQAKWVPIVDTKLVEGRGNQSETSYWPVAVSNETFHSVILKGQNLYPPIEQTVILDDMPLSIPLGRPAATQDADGKETLTGTANRLEEVYVRSALMLSLAEDKVQANGGRMRSQVALQVKSKKDEINKSLIQLIAQECAQGEDRGMKALEIVKLLDASEERLLQAAAKVAQRYGQDVLAEKIGELVVPKGLGYMDEDI